MVHSYFVDEMVRIKENWSSQEGLVFLMSLLNDLRCPCVNLAHR